MRLLGDKDFVFDLASLTVCFFPYGKQEPACCFSLPWTVALRSCDRTAEAVARLSAISDVH